MPLIPIVKYGDPILRKKVNTVTDFTNLDTLIENMFDTMYHEKGLGLAANQVGINLDILVFDISQYEFEENKDMDEECFVPNPQLFINTKIIQSMGECIMEEGCLSVPDIRAEVTRAETITIQYQDIDQNIFVETFSDLSARVLLHEKDHLNGKFFTDYLPQSKRMLIQKRLHEISLTGVPSTGIIL